MRIGYSPFIALTWAYLSRAVLRGCPLIFLVPPPDLAFDKLRAQSLDFLHRIIQGLRLRPPPPGRGAYSLRHRTAAMPGSPDPWPRLSPCGPRATSVPRRGVCRSRRICAGAMPRFHSGLSGSLVLFRCPNRRTPRPALFGRFLRQALWLLSSESDQTSSLSMRMSCVH